MVVTALDHLVLRCADVATTLAWYTDVLGLPGVRVDEWRKGDAPFPSVRVSADTIIDLIAGRSDTTGLAGADAFAAVVVQHLDHLCLVVAPTDLDALAESGRFDVIEGPASRFGARGTGTSLYVRDPDGTVVELRHY